MASRVFTSKACNSFPIQNPAVLVSGDRIPEAQKVLQWLLAGGVQRLIGYFRVRSKRCVLVLAASP